MKGIEEQTFAREVLESFQWLEDWEDRYRYIIDLGKAQPPLEEAWKTDANRVRGCQSTVYLTARRDPDSADRLIFEGESDAAIVQGLVALLCGLFSGQSPKAILDFDAEDFLKQIALGEHLSPTRQNGLHAMLRRIRAEAKAAMAD